MKDSMETVREGSLFKKVLPYVALVVLLGLTLVVWWSWRCINARQSWAELGTLCCESDYVV